MVAYIIFWGSEGVQGGVEGSEGLRKALRGLMAMAGLSPFFEITRWGRKS